MALKIKLARNGAKNNPHYSIVVGEARSKRDGQYVEKVGHYHPTRPSSDESRIVVSADRIKYWIGVGALPTERVAKLVSLKADGLLREYVPSFTETRYKGMTKKAVATLKKEEAKAVVARPKPKIAESPAEVASEVASPTTSA